jgi:D-alanyl-lipoteichoic acid acyltransferase DltB (MBOAT superfamily)
MSLTSWITDYVYIPLGGNRHGEWRAAGNRLVAMTLCGLWHGAALHFAAWGLYHGIMLNAYRGWTALRGRWRPPGPPSLAGQLASGVLTFHVVCVGWVFFVCELRQATYIAGRLLGLG